MIGGYESIVLAVLARPISIRHVRFPRSFAAFNLELQRVYSSSHWPVGK